MIVKKRVIWYSFSFVALVIASIIMLLISRGYYYDFETSSFKKNGAIYVKSIPRDTNIYINNELKKKKTPASISLPEASYKIRIEKDGFIPWSKNISIKEGYVTWENYIFLILEKRTKENITENGIKNYLISPSKNKIAYTDLNNNLWFIDINSNSHSKVYSSNNKTKLLGWDNKNEKVLVEDKGIYLIISNDDTLKIKHIPGKISKIEISKDNNDKVYALSENYLYTSSQDNLMIEEYNIIAFSQTEKNIYYSKSQNKQNELWKASFDFRTKDKILTAKSPIIKIFPSDKERYAYTTKDNNLYLRQNGETEKLYENVTFGKWSKEDKKLLYGTNQELRVYVAESNNPFENKNKIITRLSVPIENCVWFYNFNHVIYKTNNNIIFVGIDGTNSVTLVENTKSDINNFDTTKYGRSMVFAEKENNLYNIKIMKIGEKNSLIPY